MDEAYFHNLELLESDLRAIAEEKSVSAAKIIHPLRMALTGKTASPGIFEIISILGKEKVIRRIEKVINFILINNRRDNIEA